jgi:hypothetical protein
MSTCRYIYLYVFKYLGKVRQGIWHKDELVKYTGPEIFEAQMKAKRMVKMKIQNSYTPKIKLTDNA